MAPAEFADDDIAFVRKGIANVDWMVASFHVVFPILLVFSHDRWGMRRRIRAGSGHLIFLVTAER